MSFPHIGKLWIATKEDLKDVILCENVLKFLEPTKNRNEAHELIGNLYARYIVICNNLSELYDQTLHVQKRALIEKLLISSQERLKEIQKDIQMIEMSKFIYIDDALVELNLTPYDIEFLRPFYFPRKRDIECQQLIDGVVPKSDQPKVREEPKGLDKFRKVLSPEELEQQRKHELMTRIVNAIKSHEKARQARILGLNIKLYPKKYLPKEDEQEDETIDYDFYHKEHQIGKFKMKRTQFHVDLYKKQVDIVKYDYFQPPQYKINKLGHKVLVPRVKNETHEEIVEPKPITQEDKEEAQRLAEVEEKQRQVEEEAILKAIELLRRQNQAACVIQQNFLHYQLKKAIKRRKTMRMEMLGMIHKPLDLDAPNINELHDKSQHKRRERKREFDEAFLKALQDEKAHILKMKSEFIMEDITDDIRSWFREFYKEAKDFHRYPAEFEGGTIMVLRGETKTPEEFLIEKNKTALDKAREKKDKKKLKKEEKLRLKKEKEYAAKREAQQKIRELKEGKSWDFSQVNEWKAFESLENTFVEGQYSWQFIDDLKNRKELPIWEWVTLDVYCDIHKELRVIVDDLMRIELEVLRFALSIDMKKPYQPSKQKKPKKEKKKKGKKKQRKSLEDVMEGRSVDECYEELVKLNIITKYEKRSLDDFISERNYAARDLRSLNKDPQTHYGDIKTYIQTQILGTAAQIKSFCIMGPPKCGKKFLVNAICSEMDAVMFDLSAPKIKNIMDMPYFLNLVMQMAVKFQPSVLFIDGAHKPFIKKMDDDVKAEDPRKLGKYLLKSVVNYLTNDDAVVLIGVTNEPWNCNFNSLLKCYEKVAIFPPRLDYGTTVKAWEAGLRMKRIYNFDVSSLGQVTREFSVGDILESIDSCLNVNRRVMLPLKPLTCDELLENLITTKTPIEKRAAKDFNKIATKLDPYLFERKREIARVQIEIDKKNEEKAKKQAKQKKAQEKKGT